MRRSAIGLLLVLAAAGGARAEGELVDGIAAQVGSDVVLVSEVERVAGPVAQEMREAGVPESEIAKMRAEALERLIERRLISQMARRAEIEATEAEVDEAIEAIARENGLSLAELRASVESQGLSYDAYRDRLREEIVQQKVLTGMVRSRVRVEEDELRRLYRERFGDQPTSGEEVHVRQILVPFEGGSPEARRKACGAVRAAHERLRAGEPFPQVASEVSRVNPERGGDLGWLHADEIARWMDAVLEGLEPGAVSDVIETSFGCSVLQLVDRRKVEPVSFEEAKPRLRDYLRERKFEEEYRRFMEKLRAQTFIDRKGLYAEAARFDVESSASASEPPLLP